MPGLWVFLALLFSIAAPVQASRVDATYVAGYRSDTRVRFELGNTLRFGLRSDGTSMVGHARYQGEGLIRTVVAGQLSLRMGERLVLGRGFGRYPPRSSAPVAGGFVISPSLSRNFGRPGAGAGLAWREWAVQAVVIGDDEGQPEPRAGWLSLNGRWRDTQAGVVLGVPLGTPEPGGTRASIVSTHVVLSGRGVKGSVEGVRFSDGGVFGAVRVGPADGGRWTLLYFRAPSFASSVVAALVPAPRDHVNEGVRVGVCHRVSRVRLRTSVVLGGIRSKTGWTKYRRFLLSAAGGRRRRFAWEGTVQFTDDTRTRYPTAALITRSETQEVREGRLRLVLRSAPDPHLSHRVRGDFFWGPGWQGQGVLVGVSSEVRFSMLEARVAVSAYTLDSGRRGYVGRPAAGVFESFAAVSGRGSDVAMRLRWRVRPTLSVFVYRGSPWGKARRLYIGAEWHAG